jgi:signal transduction histidine kinase
MSLFHLHQQPMPLLRILERTLLAIVTVVAIISQAKYPTPWLLPLNLLLIAIFVSLSWIKPHRSSSKTLYTIVEFVVILLLALVGKLPLFALLLVVLVIRNCLILNSIWRSIVTGLTFLFYVGCYTHRLINKDIFVPVREDQIMPFWFGSIISFGLTILFLQLLVNAVATERKSRQELALANDRLQNYALKIEELATLQERNRIAREIHDSLGHTLTVFNFHLAAAMRLFHSNPSKAEALLLDLKELGDSALQEVSRSVSSLRTDPLAGLSLMKAIEDLVINFHQATGVMPDCVIDVQADLPDRYKTAIYRIVQESLTNMCKYAAMTQTSIYIEQMQQSIDIMISDNGRGFELHKNTTGFGLQGMRERVMLLSGQLEISTAPDRGCQITATLPLD